MRRESDQEGTVELEKRGMQLRNAVRQRPQRSRTRRQRSGRRYPNYGRRDGRLLGWGDERRRRAVGFGVQTATTRLQALVAAGIGDVAGHGSGLCNRSAENLQAATGESQQQD